MGFGLLFFGYFFTLQLPYKGLDVLPDIVGCILMYSALKRLIRYCPGNRGFGYAGRAIFVYGGLSAVLLGYQLAVFTGMIEESTPAWFYTTFSIVYSLAVGAYQLCLLFGIYTLSNEVGVPKVTRSSRRLISLTIVYYLLMLLSSTGVLKLLSSLTSSQEAVISYINFAVYLTGLLWMLLTLALIYSCYMRICLEGDEDMPDREDLFDKIVSRFKNNRK